jgi:hypothetical protein
MYMPKLRSCNGISNDIEEAFPDTDKDDCNCKLQAEMVKSASQILKCSIELSKHFQA